MRLSIWFAVTGAFAALGFYGNSQNADRGQDAVYSYDLLASAVVAYGLLLAVVFALTAGLPRREILALRRPRSWPVALGLSLASLAAILLGAAALLQLTGAGDEQNLAPEDWDPNRVGPYLASFLAIVLIGPFAEELLYRGAGIGLLEHHGKIAAVGATAVLFGLGHGLLLSLGAFVWFGIVTGWLRLRTESLYPALIVHSLFNAFGMIVPLLI